MNIMYLVNVNCGFISVNQENFPILVNLENGGAQRPDFIRQMGLITFKRDNYGALLFSELLENEEIKLILTKSKYMELIPIKSKINHRNAPRTIIGDWYEPRLGENENEIDQIQSLDKEKVQEFSLPQNNQIMHRGEEFVYVSAEAADHTNRTFNHVLFIYEKPTNHNEILYIYKSIYDVFIVIRGKTKDVEEIYDIVFYHFNKNEFIRS